nr:MAG TPA: hypothetical protein [Caudoviricetes sp.]
MVKLVSDKLSSSGTCLNRQDPSIMLIRTERENG